MREHQRRSLRLPAGYLDVDRRAAEAIRLFISDAVA
jgi:hypothetical protein